MEGIPSEHPLSKGAVDAGILNIGTSKEYTLMTLSIVFIDYYTYRVTSSRGCFIPRGKHQIAH